MANDAPSGHPLENSFMAVVVVDKVPHLCLFAKRDIETGEELRYDYGDPTAPWRKKVRMLRYVHVDDAVKQFFFVLFCSCILFF